MDPLDPRFQQIRDYSDGLLSDGERQVVEQLLEHDLEALEYFEQIQECLCAENGICEETAVRRELLAQQVLARVDQREKLKGSAATLVVFTIVAVSVVFTPAGDTPQSLTFKPAKARVLDMVARSYLLTDRSPVDPYEILLSPEREAEADLRSK